MSPTMAIRIINQFLTEQQPLFSMRESLKAAVEALEKQIPKKNKKEKGALEWDICPNCGYKRAGSHFKYCSECGQKLD